MNTRLCLYCQEIPGLQGHGCLACNIANTNSAIFRKDPSLSPMETLDLFASSTQIYQPSSLSVPFHQPNLSQQTLAPSPCSCNTSTPSSQNHAMGYPHAISIDEFLYPSSLFTLPVFAPSSKHRQIEEHNLPVENLYSINPVTLNNIFNNFYNCTTKEKNLYFQLIKHIEINQYANYSNNETNTNNNYHPDITYTTTLTLPYTKRKISITKHLSSGILIQDSSSIQFASLPKILDHEYEMFTKSYGKKSPELTQKILSIQQHESLTVDIYLKIDWPSINTFLGSGIEHHSGQFPSITKEQIKNFFDYRKNYLQEILQNFLHKSRLHNINIDIPTNEQANIFQITATITREDIQKIENFNEVIFIQERKHVTINLLSSYPNYNIPSGNWWRHDMHKQLPEEFYHGYFIGTGYYNNKGFRGKGVTVLVLENGLPNLNDPCFWNVDQYPLRGSHPAMRFTRTQARFNNLEDTLSYLEKAFPSPQEFKKAQRHAELITAAIVQNPEYISPYFEKCPVVGSDGTGLYGGSRGVNLLAASIHLGGTSPDWAIDIANSIPSLLIINASLVANPTFGARRRNAFNVLTTEMDRAYALVLFVAGAGNPESLVTVENAPFNGISVNDTMFSNLPPSAEDAKDTIFEKYYLFGDLIKPDVWAPALDYFRYDPDKFGLDPDAFYAPIGGTSFSAPRVTSLLALMSEHLSKAGIYTEIYPEILKAVLLSTAITVTNTTSLPVCKSDYNDTHTSTYWSSNTICWSYGGAGMVNGQAAYSVIQKYVQFVEDYGTQINFHESLGFREVDKNRDFVKDGPHFRYTWPGGQPIFIANQGETIRAVLCWTISPGDHITDFDLILEKLNPNSSIKQGKPIWNVEAASIRYDSNTEMLTLDVFEDGIFRLNIIYWTYKPIFRTPYWQNRDFVVK